MNNLSSTQQPAKLNLCSSYGTSPSAQRKIHDAEQIAASAQCIATSEPPPAYNTCAELIQGLQIGVPPSFETRNQEAKTGEFLL